jgi:hypothetical protein
VILGFPIQVVGLIIEITRHHQPVNLRHHLPAMDPVHMSHQRFAFFTDLKKAFKAFLVKVDISGCDLLQ